VLVVCVDMKIVVGAAIIKKGKLLLGRKGNYWIFPGGKMADVDEGDDIKCLCREVEEEFSGTKLRDVIYYNTFVRQAIRGWSEVEERVYLANIDGKLCGVREGDSILEARWIDDFSTYNFSEITSMIIDSLKKDGYLK